MLRAGQRVPGVTTSLSALAERKKGVWARGCLNLHSDGGAREGGDYLWISFICSLSFFATANPNLMEKGAELFQSLTESFVVVALSLLTCLFYPTVFQSPAVSFMPAMCFPSLDGCEPKSPYRPWLPGAPQDWHISTAWTGSF